MAGTTLAINQAITLGINLASQLTPVITGIVKSIESRTSANGSITYTIAIETGQQELVDAQKNFQTSIDEINTELAKQSAPPVVVPPVVDALHNPTPAPTTTKTI